jgi:glycosyltransferase 2 family protein
MNADRRELRRAALRRLKPVLAVLAVAACVWALVSQWADVSEQLARIGVAPMVVSVLCGITNNWLNAQAWRTSLEGLGSPIGRGPATTSFFASQLGKYIPGSVWPVVAQVSLNERHGVPASRSVVAFAVTLFSSLTTALLVSAVTLPFVATDAVRQYWWTWCLVPPLVALLHPRVMKRVFVLASRLTRRDWTGDLPSGATMLRMAAWLTGGWLVLGIHLGVLADRVDTSSGSVWLASLGAFALAWAAGLLAIIAPAGIGVREAVLVAALAPIMPVASTTAVALLSRVALTAADLICGLGAAIALSAVRRRARSQP